MSSEHLWIAFGLLGQAFFFSRFLVQWIASEKAGESVFPMAFCWYLSLSGGMLLLIYAIYRQDPVFILGQSTGAFIYLRNIHLRRMKDQVPNE
ncbi:MAG: lipid-A-disaccharide synthase N-terminal domain-containing protein [Woeseiaceae bacterium]|nr:lipid-A-disaccharide synthase N-terminal domain-containing protein [Woeseiaceae bacterium]